MSSEIDLLAQAERKIPRITKSTEAMVSDTDTSKGTVGFMYIKRDIVRLVGALAYQDRQIQDKVRASENAIIHSNCYQEGFANFIQKYCTQFGLGS